MTVHDLEVTRPATDVQTVRLPVVNASPNPGTVHPLSVVQSGTQTVNFTLISAATE